MTFTRTETKEERFARLVREALEYGRDVAASREHSLAMTNLEQAGMWAAQDMEVKAP